MSAGEFGAGLTTAGADLPVQQLAERVGTSPLGALVGCYVLGAALGAVLLWRTRSRETVPGIHPGERYPVGKKAQRNG